MAHKLTLPRLGLTMEAGTVVEWFKKDGDLVKPGDRIFAVETDKAVQDYESPEGGILRLVPEVAAKQVPFELKVDATIGYLLAEGEAVPAEMAEAAAAPAQEPVAVAAGVAAEPTKRRIKASPLARKLAEQHGIDLATIVPEDRDKIQRKDIEKALALRAAVAAAKAAPVAQPAAQPVAAPVTAPLAGRAVPMTQVRRVIAQRMAESAQTTAAVTEFTEADVTKLVEFREQVKASMQAAGMPAPSYTDLFIKLTALALREHPALNSVLAGDEIIQMNDVHMAVAVDTDAGLLVPVVRDVLRKSVYEISNETRALVEKARERKIGPDDLQGGTFTITNLGTYGIDGFTPIINLPQCAILGIGRIVAKPAEWQGQIALRRMVTLSLTFDHRVVDGGPAARFLDLVRRYAEDPNLWLLR